MKTSMKNEFHKRPKIRKTTIKFSLDGIKWVEGWAYHCATTGLWHNLYLQLYSPDQTHLRVPF